MLTYEKSLWSSDIYFDVVKDVLGAKIAKLSDKFITKVFEGSYLNAGQWAREMYNYVVLFAQITDYEI
jgi:hypothetical protein